MKIIKASSLFALAFSISLTIPIASAHTTPTVFDLEKSYSRTFPFAALGRITVLGQDDGSVKVCAVGGAECSSAKLPNLAGFIRSHIPFPLIDARTPTWLAESSTARYVCALTEGQEYANCIQLENNKKSDIDISATRKGVIPALTFSSQIHSKTYLQRYAEAFTSALRKAALKREIRRPTVQ